MQDKLLNLGEVMKILNITKKGTIYAMIHRRAIPTVKLTGKILRFSEKAINEWITAGSVNTAVEKPKPQVECRGRPRKNSNIASSKIDDLVQQAIIEGNN